MNGQNGSTDDRGFRVASSAPAARIEPSPRPSKRGSITVWVNDTVEPLRWYSAKPATSPSTRISNRPDSGLSTTLGSTWSILAQPAATANASLHPHRTPAIGALPGACHLTGWG